MWKVGERTTLCPAVLGLFLSSVSTQAGVSSPPARPVGRSKPVLTQAWVNDAAYFDGTGFALVNFTAESGRMQRFEQEVKLLSHNGVLLLLQNGVRWRSCSLLSGF